MASEELEMEITYEKTFDDHKKRMLHPATKLSMIICFIVPIAMLLIYELIMILVFYKTGFSLDVVLFMSVFPAAYVSTMILYIPTMLFIGKKTWESQKRVPLKRKWRFTNQGIVFDKGFVSTTYVWSVIGSVLENKESVGFLFTNNKIFNMEIPERIPKRAFDDEKLKQLYTLLQKYLDNDKLKFKSFEELKASS